MREMMMRPKGAVDVVYDQCPDCGWDERIGPAPRCPVCGHDIETMPDTEDADGTSYKRCTRCSWDQHNPVLMRCPKCGSTTGKATRWELPPDAALMTERPTPTPSTAEDIALVQALLRDGETVDDVRARNKKAHKRVAVRP